MSACLKIKGLHFLHQVAKLSVLQSQPFPGSADLPCEPCPMCFPTSILLLKDEMQLLHCTWPLSNCALSLYSIVACFHVWLIICSPRFIRPPAFLLLPARSLASTPKRNPWLDRVHPVVDLAPWCLGRTFVVKARGWEICSLFLVLSLTSEVSLTMHCWNLGPIFMSIITWPPSIYWMNCLKGLLLATRDCCSSSCLVPVPSDTDWQTQQEKRALAGWFFPHCTGKSGDYLCRS